MVYIDTENCDGCGLCVDACSHGALKLANGVVELDDSLCQASGACLEVCPTGALLEINETAEKVQHPLVVPDTPLVRGQETAVSNRATSILPWLGAGLQFLVTDVVPEILGYWRRRRLLTKMDQLTAVTRTGRGRCGGERKLRRRRRKGRRV